MKPFIDIQNVSYKVGNKQLLKDINLQIYKNEFVSIIGDNGSGKTTLCKLIMGIIKPTEGKILIDGQDLSKLSLYQVGEQIGYLFQNPSHQIFASTIEEEMSFALKYRGMDQGVIRHGVEEMIENLSLSKAKDTATYFLSQGEKQRLAIGAILLTNPQFLILDEPTTGIDYVRKADLGRVLEHVLERNIGIIIVSHDLEFVEKYSKRIVHIRDGCVDIETND